MPKEYEEMRDRFMRKGLSKKAAQAKAARIWNADHPNNPVTRHHESRRDTKRKARHKRRK